MLPTLVQPLYLSIKRQGGGSCMLYSALIRPWFSHWILQCRRGSGETVVQVCVITEPYMIQVLLRWIIQNSYRHQNIYGTQMPQPKIAQVWAIQNSYRHQNIYGTQMPPARYRSGVGNTKLIQNYKYVNQNTTFVYESQMPQWQVSLRCKTHYLDRRTKTQDLCMKHRCPSQVLYIARVMNTKLMWKPEHNVLMKKRCQQWQSSP